MKAWLILQKRIPPKTHDLQVLNELLVETGLVMSCSRNELREMSIGAVMFRYPGESAGKEMAVLARKLSKRIRKELLAWLGVPKLPARKAKTVRKN